MINYFLGVATGIALLAFSIWVVERTGETDKPIPFIEEKDGE